MLLSETQQSGFEPKFFNQVQQEFPSLVKNLLKSPEADQQKSRAQIPLELIHRYHDHFYHINKSFLKDFWRHEEERRNGDYLPKMLCESVGQNFAKGYDIYGNFFEAESKVSSMNRGQQKFTRWQEVACKFFGYLLGCSKFDPVKNIANLTSLLRLREKASKEDPELERIISFYLKNLPL
eukprot:TRINITY_DN5426_c0_g1_i2.p1 TRINITY_DN5426_c0_g1~~TRINITY_DN5426_c0_g1_i2.p1  ORF type:complete len:180 (+),score=42.15 TRINITY_DN5426_c0_g1_i2:86-625(+)